MLRARFKFDPTCMPMHYKELDGDIFTVEEVFTHPDGDKLMLCSHSWRTNKGGRFIILESCLEYLTED